VHTLIAQFTDLHGVARGKFVPLAHLDDLLTDGAGFSGPSIAGTGLPRCGPRIGEAFNDEPRSLSCDESARARAHCADCSAVLSQALLCMHSLHHERAHCACMHAQLQRTRIPAGAARSANLEVRTR
jgi:hypothetical protein